MEIRSKTFEYISASGDYDYTSIASDAVILVNAAMADTKFIRLPEATTTNGGMHIRVIFGIAPSAKCFVGFVTSKIVGGVTSISDGNAGNCSTNPAYRTSAVGDANLRIEVKKGEDARAGGLPGTVLDFHYTGVANIVLHRGNLIGEADTPTLASYFSTTAVNA
jgi:hypothetical protein